MVRQTRESRLDDLVTAFTELAPVWGRWTNACTPALSVSYIRMRLLRVLDQSGDHTMTEIARALDITQRRVTALVDALAADGYVERTPNPADGRSTVISLTAQGRSSLDTIWQHYRSEVGTGFEVLSVEQQQQLLEITATLTAGLRERLAARPDGPTE